MLPWTSKIIKGKRASRANSPIGVDVSQHLHFHQKPELADHGSSSTSAMSQAVPIVFGSALVGRGINDPKQVQELLDILEKGDVKYIDTAKAYTGSEDLLGQTKAAERFVIDTKCPGSFIPGNSTGDEVVNACKESLQKLGTKQVNIYYLHTPDAQVPISDTLAGVQKLYEMGVFKRFGLSNYEPEDVRKVYDHCKEHNYVLPTVYQGHYNPVARKPETVWFPLLRELGISFYAYSPIAGGFLTKTKQQVLDGEGRFDPATAPGAMYLSLFGGKESYLNILEEWEAIANDAGCSKADLAYRWTRYNSGLDSKYGDAMIIGASRLEQVPQTLEGTKAGPLEKTIVDRINALWAHVEKDAPLDNYNDFLKGMAKSK